MEAWTHEKKRKYMDSDLDDEQLEAYLRKKDGIISTLPVHNSVHR